jgi:T-complex protein 1 subunit eta
MLAAVVVVVVVVVVIVIFFFCSTPQTHQHKHKHTTTTTNNNNKHSQDSVLIDGVAFKKTFSYAGFEQQPKRFENPKVVCLNVELELKAERDNAELEVKSTEEYQRMVDAEWKIIFDKLENIANTGAKVVLSRLAIGDLGTQYFADRNIFCAGRVDEADLRRVEKATGAKVQTSVNALGAEVLGTCALFEEKQVGRERYNLLTGCKQARTATIILRGGGQHFTEEAERSLHDAIMIVRRARKHQHVVAGGGATEMEVARELKDTALSIQGKQQAIMLAFARALEVIPRQVADNAGLDSILILNKLRQKHASSENRWYGVDIATGGVTDTMASFVWEPALVKLNSITAATEAACLILSIDETIRHPQAEQQQQGLPGGM